MAFFITFGVFVLSRMIQFDLSVYGVLNSEEFQDYLLNSYYLVLIVCFCVIILCVFTLQMLRKLGFANMLSIISGKYRSPRREDRIFMFISLGGIEKIISTTGNMEYHNFINDFIYDISDSIRIHKGTITQYMEDEIMVTWNYKNGIKNANCIRTYFHLRQVILGHLEFFHSKYGLIPKPVCAIHAGTVIQAEIGELKSEISYFGDVVNSTSRILHESIHKGIEVLVSQSVINILQIPVFYETQKQGSFTPRGKKKSLQLYSVGLRQE